MKSRHSQPTESEFWFASDVKERGWTDAMIRDFLGEPDKRQNRAQYRGTVYRLYAKARVEAAMGDISEILRITDEEAERLLDITEARA